MPVPRQVSMSLLGILLLAGLILLLLMRDQRTALDSVQGDLAMERVQLTWEGYKRYFIDQNGRVRRPLNDNDSVSEGQAYAMLRAVWLDDKQQFDNCYRWTEENLSRAEEAGDSLLAWHWKDGKVQDWMPASDADIDFALSLIFAESRWGATAPEGLSPYGERARLILADILRLLTRKGSDGRLLLLPWLQGTDEPTIINLSYYSPAHFRVFFSFTSDERWLTLRDSSYRLLFELLAEFDSKKGRGLVPDWAVLAEDGKYLPLENRSADFGWEAIRVPFRFYLDYHWFANLEAKRYLVQNFAPFLKGELKKNSRIFSEYPYLGDPKNPYESSAFYASYALAAELVEPSLHAKLSAKTQQYLVERDGVLVYENEKDYYRNSLAWLAAAAELGLLRNLARSED